MMTQLRLSKITLGKTQSLKKLTMFYYVLKLIHVEHPTKIQRLEIMAGETCINDPQRALAPRLFEG